jgi:GNAT superfamily N-acetyltransferase
MVSHEIDISTATAADREVIVSLLLEQLREHNIETPANAVASAVDGVIADNSRGFVLIARQGIKAMGIACVSFVWTLEHGGRSAWLDELYVIPESRNRGIGKTLLAAVLQTVEAAGCIAIDLEVDRTHARAEHLYAREGFTPLPRCRWVRDLAPHSSGRTPGS